MKRIGDLERKYVLEVIENQFETSKNGIFNTRLEAAFAQRFGRAFALGHTNGTSTMHTALKALGVGPGDEVVVPPLTMSSTAIVVLHCGAIPVFADVDPGTLTLDPDAVRKVITDRTKAMIPVSLYGLAPDYDGLLSICDQHSLGMVEDNAECFLGEYKGKLVGQFGHFASYSFQASKHMSSGAGGMLITDDEELADKARRFSILGYATVKGKSGSLTKSDIQDPNFARHATLGWNYRMSELQAAVALGQLERLDELVEARCRSAQSFMDAVSEFSFLRPQEVPDGYRNTYWTCPLILETEQPEIDWYTFRDLYLKNGGDGYYAAWLPNYLEPLFQNEAQGGQGAWQDLERGLCPNAEFAQKRLMQFKTNYWDEAEGRQQADVLHKTAREYNG